MGTWFLATAYSNFVAAQIASIVARPEVGQAVTAVADAVSGYTALFDQLFWIGLAGAAVLLLITPILKRLMAGVH